MHKIIELEFVLTFSQQVAVYRKSIFKMKYGSITLYGILLSLA
jgi:hypothetical protein